MFPEPIFINFYVLRIVGFFLTASPSIDQVLAELQALKVLQDVSPLVSPRLDEKRGQSCYLFTFPERATLSASADLLL